MTHFYKPMIIVRPVVVVVGSNSTASIVFKMLRVVRSSHGVLEKQETF